MVESEATAQALRELGLTNVVAVGSVRADTPALNEFETLSPNLRSAVYIGRVSESKGALELLAAAQLAPDWSFDIYGPVDAALEGLFFKRLEACQNAKYCGVVRPDQTVRIFARYSAALLPSRWQNEGIPGSILEAAMAGTPTVASRIGQIPSFIRHRTNGFLVACDDIPAGVAVALSEIASMDDANVRRFRTRTRDIAAERLSATRHLLQETLRI
jgi:glycosyltransferase involved in cell wall biosynthesis